MIPLEGRPYGMRDFNLQDPSNNELGFGDPTESSGSLSRG